MREYGYGMYWEDDGSIYIGEKNIKKPEGKMLELQADEFHTLFKSG